MTSVPFTEYTSATSKLPNRSLETGDCSLSLIHSTEIEDLLLGEKGTGVPSESLSYSFGNINN